MNAPDRANQNASRRLFLDFPKTCRFGKDAALSDFIAVISERTDKIHKTKGQCAARARWSTLEVKERIESMEQTITQSGALYFVQHKGIVSDTRRRRDTVPRIGNFRIRPLRGLPRIRLPRTVLYHDDER
jgi:hypothetical protein